MTYLYETHIKVKAPVEEVFKFFSEAANLEKITPPWLQFKILSPQPIKMSIGTLIDYRLSLHGLPINWKTKITMWEPPYRFVDEQLKGPYKQWIHEHSFREDPDGCLISDKVNYQISGWIFPPLINTLFVRKDIEKIFSYRKKLILAYFRDNS